MTSGGARGVGVPGRTARDLGGSALGTFGAAEALARFRAGHLLVRPGALERLPLLDVDDLAHAADRQGVHVVVPGDEGWPLVSTGSTPPYALFVRATPTSTPSSSGRWPSWGSRAATDYGMRTAADLAEGLGARGFTIISGAAYGIDSAAHRAPPRPVGPPSPSWPVGPTVSTPQPTAACSTRSFAPGRSSRGARRRSALPQPLPSPATASSPPWPAPRSSSRPANGPAR